jgi:hypothetical protein
MTQKLEKIQRLLQENKTSDIKQMGNAAADA